MICRFVVLTAAALGMAAAADVKPDVKTVEEIVAKVNGDIITRGELDERQHEIELTLRDQQHLNGPQLTKAVTDAAKDMLRDKIDELLLVQKAKDNQINVDSDVSRRMADIQVTSKISDPDKFHEWVQQQTGMAFEEYKQKLTNDLLVRRVVMQEIGSRITTPEAELRKYYDEHKTDFVRKEQVFLSQILISTEGKTPEQVAAAEKRAADVSARAQRGEKFSTLVQTYSDDQETARSGGELGPYQRGVMPKDMEDVVFAAKKGYVTKPFKRPQGFVILRVDDKWEAGQASFDEVREQIQEAVSAPRMEERMRPFLQKLRTDAFLEIKDGFVDSGAAPGKDTSWHDVAVLKPLTTTKEEVAAAHKRHRHLLFVPVPGTVEKRGKKNIPTDTALLGERKRNEAAAADADAANAPAAAPAGDAPATPAEGQPAQAAENAAAPATPGTPAAVEASFSKSGRGKTRKAAAKPASDKPAQEPSALAPIQQ
jgi:peptidyl-prolyl cis-trans isomerase SurA